MLVYAQNMPVELLGSKYVCAVCKKRNQEINNMRTELQYQKIPFGWLQITLSSWI
jgi:hypothetical protein